MDLLPSYNFAQGFISTGNAFNDPGKLSLLLMQIMIILFTCRMISLPFSYLHQPIVIAEVIGGILLGPTALGRWPWFRSTFFPDGSMKPLQALADIGLILFMLLIGLELDMKIVLNNLKTSFTISIWGFAFPFASSVAVSYFMYNNLEFSGIEKPEFYKFLLFIGVAMSVTALPVLARILTEKKLSHSRMGIIILAAAAVDDATCWILLALVIALLGSSQPIVSLYIFLATLVFAGIMFFIVAPLIRKLQIHFDQGNQVSYADGVPSISQPLVVAAFLLTLVSSFVTNAIGIHTIFGGFLTGIILPRENGFAVALTHRIEDFVSIILLPLYFTASGLKTDIGSLDSGIAWGCFFLVFVVAAIGKIGGCGSAAKLSGLGWRESLAIGCAMNTKGLVEIIILNIGLDNRILTTQMFAIMVLFAICTTLMTSPLIDVLFPQIDLSPPLSEETKILDEKGFASALEKDLNMVIGIPSLSLVPSTMNFMQYVQGPTDMVSRDDTYRAKVVVHAARFLQINERMSTILLASNEQATIMRDPALNIFKAFGDLKHISVVPHLLVSRISEFPKDLAQLAYANQSELVVIPLQPATVISKEPEPTSVSAWLSLGESSRPKIVEDSIVSHLNMITDQLIRKCRVKVAVLVDPGVQKQSLNSLNILIPFFGGIDDRESILFALRIGSLRNANIHILHITLIDSQNKPNSSQGDMDLEDSKMIEYIQSISKKDGFGQCLVTYEKAKSDKPYDLILTNLEKKNYSLVIVGHFGPFWSVMMSEENQDESSEEQNNGTVWSLSKIQATISSLSSNIDRDSMNQPISKSFTCSLLEKVLGPTGIQIYNRNPSSAALLVLRKFRIDKSLLPDGKK